MSQKQFPPANAGGKTNPVNCADLTLPYGPTAFNTVLEFPESFGASQESADWELTGS